MGGDVDDDMRDSGGAEQWSTFSVPCCRSVAATFLQGGPTESDTGTEKLHDSRQILKSYRQFHGFGHIQLNGRGMVV